MDACRTIADGIEWSYGWETPAAQRLRFVLDFPYATGLRVSELVRAGLGNIEADARGDRWVSLNGRGRKAGKVALPPLARTALDRYPVARRLPAAPTRWHPDTPLIGSLERDSTARPASVVYGYRRLRDDSLQKRPKSSRRTTRYSRKSCVAQVRTGRGTPTQLRRSTPNLALQFGA